MANRNTRQRRAAKTGFGSTYKAKTGRAVNSSQERAKTGKARYSPPTFTDRTGTPRHKISGLTPRQMQEMVP